MIITIVGVDKLVAKLKPELIEIPLRNFLTRSAIMIQSEARKRAPVDTGLLRSSIGYELGGQSGDQYAKIGSKVFYAPFMEYGTGLVGDPAVPHGGRHHPPGAALDVWAARHGFSSGYQVAAIIAKRGGLTPRLYMRRAFEASLRSVRVFLDQMGDEIKRRWDG